MKLKLDRFFKGKDYTIGKLYIDDIYYCDVIEDIDRGLTQDMDLKDIKKIKVQNETAIPRGTYEITMNVISPKFSLKKFYKDNCKGGRVPRLLNVPGFDGILIHCGSTQLSSAGCLIVGYNKIKGRVVDSEKVFLELYTKLLLARDKITIEIY